MSTDALRARVAMLEAALEAEHAAVVAERQRADALAAERDRLRAAFVRLQEEMELLRRRIFVAKAERIDSAQLELEFHTKRAELAALASKLGAAAAVDEDEDDDDDDD